MWIEFHSYHEVSHLDNLPAAVHDDASEDDKATKSKSPHQKDDGAACTFYMEIQASSAWYSYIT